MKTNRDVFFLEWVEVESTYKLIERVAKKYDEDPTLPIRLFISSGGGRPNPACAFFEWTRVQDIPLETIALGNVSSSAIVIYAAGRNRKATETAHFLFHNHTRSYEKETMDVPKLRSEFEDLKFIEWKRMEIISSVTGQAIGKIEEMCRAETRLTATEARKFGLVHKVIHLKQIER